MSDHLQGLIDVIRGSAVTGGQERQIAFAINDNFHVTPRPKTEFLLAIGGPKDGERLEIREDTNTFFYATSLEDSPDGVRKIHRYERERIQVGDRTHGTWPLTQDVLVWTGHK